MANYYVINPVNGASIPVSTTATVPQFQLGAVVTAMDIVTNTTQTSLGVGHFAYVAGSNIASSGQMVAFTGNTVGLASSGGSIGVFQVGVAAGVLSATSVYGFVQIYGLADYCKGTNQTWAFGYPAKLGSTAGQFNNTTNTGLRIIGCDAWASAASSQSASLSMRLYYPQYLGTGI